VAREDQRTGGAGERSFTYQQLDALRTLRLEVRRGSAAESKKTPSWKRPGAGAEIPSIGPDRAAVLLGILQTPHRFRTKRSYGLYSGVGIETPPAAAPITVLLTDSSNGRRSSGDSRAERNYNHDLKNLSRSSHRRPTKPVPSQSSIAELLAKGMRPEMAPASRRGRCHASVLIVWKRGVSFDAQHLKPQTA